MVILISRSRVFSSIPVTLSLLHLHFLGFCTRGPLPLSLRMIHNRYWTPPKRIMGAQNSSRSYESNNPHLKISSTAVHLTCALRVSSEEVGYRPFRVH